MSSEDLINEILDYVEEQYTFLNTELKIIRVGDEWLVKVPAFYSKGMGGTLTVALKDLLDKLKKEDKVQ